MAEDPRTGLETLSEEECWRLLGEGQIGRLAVVAAGQPDVFPVNYVVDGGDIVIRTAAGMKLAAAIFGPSVAFEIDAVDVEHRQGWSVVVKGEATEVEHVDELVEAAELTLEPWTAADKPRYVRIVASEVTGRRIPGSR